MKLDTKQCGRHLVVTILEERLGADRAPNFKESLARLIEQGHEAFVLDFSQVKFIDSSGLGAILATSKRLGKPQGILVVGTSESVGSMFRLTRMDRVFPMFRTVEDALVARV
jgi:anti-sigma B factor antagonist